MISRVTSFRERGLEWSNEYKYAVGSEVYDGSSYIGEMPTVLVIKALIKEDEELAHSIASSAGLQVYRRTIMYHILTKE